MLEPELDLKSHLASVFERLHRALPELVGVGLADANGLPVAFRGPAGGRAPATAMATLLVSAAQRASQALGLPPTQEVLITSEGYHVLVTPLGDAFTLVAILANETNLGFARLQVQASAEEIRALLGQA